MKIFAPATIANLGSGFDVLGIAIDAPGDIVTAERTREPGLSFRTRSRFESVPAEPKNNVAAHVASLFLQETKPQFGVKMLLDKKMPIGSGLGSSAASSVASVVAVNKLLPRPLHKKDLLRFAVEGERMASGAPHADNAAPSLLGGACLIRSYEPLDVVPIPVRNTLIWVVVHPQIVVRTEEARNILPRAITLRTAVYQWGNISGLTIGLASGDPTLVGKCVEDAIAEPVRANLIPGFREVKRDALRAGAYGCSISGSGPSVFAVADSFSSGRRIAASMQKAFRRAAGIRSEAYISLINKKGAVVIPERRS
ncbi:MAG TPA: homoserine kinase [Bacteroidota bacterium]|nr:homoserine kinase [Bacteroidota bacterium]